MKLRINWRFRAPAVADVKYVNMDFVNYDYWVTRKAAKGQWSTLRPTIAVVGTFERDPSP